MLGFWGFFALTKSQFGRKCICAGIPVIAGQTETSSDLVDLTGFAWPGMRELFSLLVIFIIRRAPWCRFGLAWPSEGCAGGGRRGGPRGEPGEDRMVKRADELSGEWLDSVIV